MTLYYIARPGGERQGPFPETTVRANLEHPGFYAADTLAWCKGMSEWKPLREVLGTTPSPAAEAPRPAPTLKTAEAPRPQVPPAAPKIYYLAERGGERKGPYDLAGLMALPRTPLTLAWKKGMVAWAPIASVLAAANGAAARAAAGVGTGAPEAPPPLSFLTLLRFFFPLLDRRVGVGRFWCGMVALFALCHLYIYICELCGGTADSFPLFFVMVLLPSFFMQLVGRLHDSDLSGWAALLVLIPFFGWFGLFIIVCVPGTVGANKYGHYCPLF